jgi:DNA primase
MAKLIPENFINNLLARIDLVDLINARVPLQKKGKNYTARCPFHAEKTPSFSVDPAKQFYHCFGCGASGDAIKFLRTIDNLTFVEAVEILAASQGLQLPTESNTEKQAPVAKEIYEVLAVAAKFYSQQLKTHPAAKAVIAYLQARGLSGHTAKKFNLGYAPPGWENLKQYVLQHTGFTLAHLEQAGLLITKANSAYDRFRHRVMFPIYNRKGQVIGFGGRVITPTEEPKYLNSPETVVFNKGKELYGLHEARLHSDKLTKLIVVEGYMDVLALSQANINNVIAILGTALTIENIKLLFRLVPEIIFCFDADSAGQKAAWKALELCLPLLKPTVKVYFLFLPEPEDPDSYLRKYGKDKFLEQINRAVSLADYFFSHLTHQMDLELTEDRAAFAGHARELLQQIPDGVFKHMMFDRLANLASIDRAFLEAEFPVNQNKTHENNYFKKQTLNKKPGSWQLPKSPAIFAVALLLKYPELINLLPNDDIEHYKNVALPGAELFFSLASILKIKPQVSFAEIKALLPPSIAKRFVPEELSNLASLVPKTGIEQEFLGIMLKIKALAAEQNLETLLNKAKITELSAKEKVQLQQLLLAKDA